MDWENHLEKIQSKKLKTYPADCRKIAAVDSNKHDWIEITEDIEKKRFLCKNIFLSPIYFDGISWLNILLF